MQLLVQLPEDDENTIEERIEREPAIEEFEEEEEDEVEEKSSGFNLIPVLVGGVSAAALGVAAYLASNPHQIDIPANSRNARSLASSLEEEGSQIVQGIAKMNKRYITRDIFE